MNYYYYYYILLLLLIVSFNLDKVFYISNISFYNYLIDLTYICIYFINILFNKIIMDIN